MPREPRIYVENVLYLVTAKGDEDRELFSDPQDYNTYLKSLSEYKNEHGFKLFAFALLPKSLYMLIELKENVTISQIMHDLNSNYTKSHNSRYGKKGHLFQSRFKSILIEKDNYLLRLSRYIHLLPKDDGLVDDPGQYRYGSLSSYLSADAQRYFSTEMPDMGGEIKEILDCYADLATDADKRTAYGDYVRSADGEEAELVRKLLHRKAFVGSKDFVQKIRGEIKQHIIEEEEARTVRKTNPAFAVAGGLVILFLGVVAYNLYNSQATLQQALNVTSTGLETVRNDLVSRVFHLQSTSEDLEKRLFSLQEELGKIDESAQLNGVTWEIRLSPVHDSVIEEGSTDMIAFKDDRVTIKGLNDRGFPSMSYSLAPNARGGMLWEAANTRPDGTNVEMRGLWTGQKVKGIVRETPVQGQNRDFIFVSLRRIENLRGEANALQ